MCTLLTVDRDTFLTDRHLFVARMLRDADYNSDGFNLIAIDMKNPSLDMNFSCMNIALIVRMIDAFFDGCSVVGRIFLHSRAATTDFVGIPFNHGFTDFKGTLVQHNGIVHNYRDLTVDSHNLIDLDLSDARELQKSLDLLGEYFANIFLVRPDRNSYGVIRQMAGSLHTDGDGNYSTNIVAGIDYVVPSGYAAEHRFQQVTPSSKVPVPYQFNQTDDRDESYETAWDSIVDKKSRAG